MKLFIIIPAFNEEKIIGSVLDGLKKVRINGLKIEIVVINDGSIDRTAEKARKKKIIVISHFINRGLGGALGTGIEYAKNNKADLIVTFDADGQHNPGDIEKIIMPILKKRADMVIGSRLTRNSEMPLDRKIINYGANLINFLLWGVWVTDTQSGLRAFSKKAIEGMEIKMNKMEVSSEFLKEAGQNKLRIKEVPIKAIYTEYSKAKGQKNINSLSIFAKLILHKLVNIK